MAENNKPSTLSKLFAIALLIIAGLLLWKYDKELFIMIAAYANLVIIGLILFVALPIMFLLVIPYFSRLFHYFKRAHTMETVKVVFSRRDGKNSSDMINFFDFLNGVLLPEFYAYYKYLGANFDCDQYID